MQQNFERAVEFTLSFEGGYSNDPNDPGGETRFGISKKNHPNEDILHMTVERAKEIYRDEYWNVLHLDEAPWPTDVAAFDTGVNCGVARANGWILRSASWKQVLLQRIAYYIDLTRRKPELARYLNGWLSRVISLAALCGRDDESH
jgi:lysozyme family protein